MFQSNFLEPLILFEFSKLVPNLGLFWTRDQGHEEKTI